VDKLAGAVSASAASHALSISLPFGVLVGRDVGAWAINAFRKPRFDGRWSSSRLRSGCQDIASREDVKELGDVCAEREIGPLVLVKRRDLGNRHAACSRQRRDDSPLVGPLLVRCGHGGFHG
jgi:hypothetical protein